MKKLKRIVLEYEDGSTEDLVGFVLSPNLRPVIKTTIADAIQKYVKNCTSNKCIKNQNTEKLYFKIFREFLESEKITHIDQVSREHVDRFESILLRKMKASSVNRRFCAIRNLFSKCIEWGLANESPFQGKKKRKFEKNPFKPWSPELYEKFIGLCGGNWRNMFRFLWLTGCRPMELKNLRWTDVDYENQTIKFRCGKNSQISRNFPITNEIDKFLHGLQMNGSFVFTGSDKKPINNDSLYHYCKKRMVKLGLVGYTVYGIRHGFGTRLARQGVSAFYIAELMGHSDLKTTRGYVHSDKKLLIEILNKAK